MNKLFYGDNLDVMRKFIRPTCVGTVDLCYTRSAVGFAGAGYNQIYNNIGTTPSARARPSNLVKQFGHNSIIRPKLLGGIVFWLKN